MRPVVLTTTHWGLDRSELVTTLLAFLVSSSLFVAWGHPYLARGVVGDLIGLWLLSLAVLRRRRLRHEALVCLACIGIVLFADPGWPLRISGIVWWSAITAGVVAYLALRRHVLILGQAEPAGRQPE
jgi:hypothetical protein